MRGNKLSQENQNRYLLLNIGLNTGKFSRVFGLDTVDKEQIIPKKMIVFDMFLKSWPAFIELYES